MGEIMMKSVTVLLAFLSLASWAAPNLSQKVTLKMKNVTADAALKEVSARTHVKFEFDSKIKFTKPLSIDVKQASLKDVLDFIVAAQNVKWTAGESNSIKIVPAK
jgi:hypothetical protein